MTRKLTILLSILTLIALAAVPAAAAPLNAPCVAGQGYDPACDVDHDGDVDVLDIQLTANRWGSSGTFIEDGGWSLTGSAGTTPGANYLGTSDNVPLEIKVNSERAMRIAPAADALFGPSITFGYSGNAISDSASSSTIGGGGRSGFLNLISVSAGTISGGFGNQVTGDGGTIGGGRDNRAGTFGYYATVAGGSGNHADALASAAGGGNNNTASGMYATIPGGENNLASGSYSFAAGRRAKASNTGAFVLADSNNFDFAPGVNNAFTARFTGGVRFITGIDGTGATTWQCTVYNGGSWGCSSDRNVKENFVPVDGKEVLAKLATLPITTWNAIGTDPNVRRMGPMAQDFYATFGLGDDDKVITTGDLDGVALASIQGLYELVQELQAENQALRDDITALQAQLTGINAGPTALETAN